MSISSHLCHEKDSQETEYSMIDQKDAENLTSGLILASSKKQDPVPG